MKKLNRTAAAAGTAAVLATLGLGGAVTAAQADTNPPAPSVQTSDGDGEVNDATEGPEKESEEAQDGPDQGRDANPNEPGHQDADESGETEGAESETEEAQDGPDQGADANPNEPGHQDADESGETQ